MSKIVTLLLAFFSLILSVNSENCGTPIECYAQAIDLLARDRTEMRRVSDQMFTSQHALEEKMNLALALSQLTISELQSNITLIKNNFTERIVALEEEIKQLKEIKDNKNYMFREAIIYQNIFEALEKNVIAKLGYPNGWDEQSFRQKEWNKRKMLRIGNGPQTNGNGLKVNVPEGYDLMWLRVTNDKSNVFRINSLEFQEDIVEKYDCFYRGLNEISPDGTTSDSYAYELKWCPIPLHKNGSYVVYTDAETDGWITGIAFSKNIWKITKNGAFAYIRKINGGTGVQWVSDRWNEDVLGMIQESKVTELFVPVIPSEKDKLLYIVEHNSNWDGLMHTRILVNDKPVERLRTTYQNPFSYHVNSKYYNRYAAVRVPKNYIPENSKFINVKIDMTFNNKGIFFREIGTHDYIE